jgi:hypothetical protein
MRTCTIGSSYISISFAPLFIFNYIAEYRTVSGVAGPLVILEKVKVGYFTFLPVLLSFLNQDFPFLVFLGE